MRHSLYANNRKIPTGSGANRDLSLAGSPRSVIAPDPKDKKTIILENLYRRALDLYKDDKETRDEILNRGSMYPINVSLARKCGDKKQEKQLTNELINFLNQKIKEKR